LNCRPGRRRTHIQWTTHELVFEFKTDLNAPFGFIISINTCKPPPAKIDEFVLESKDKLAVSRVGNRFVALYSNDAHSAVRSFKRDGTADGRSTFRVWEQQRDFYRKIKRLGTFRSFTSYTTPTEIFSALISTNVRANRFQPK